jgi:hypothetical protein
MLLGMDLTPRQAARVLEQALRNRAEFEIEPRNTSDDQVICGRLTGREGDLLVVELPDRNPPTPLLALIGAFCDVRTELSGELYLFSTCVMDLSDASVPQRLLLAVPQTLQVANRRRFERRTPGSWAQAHLSGGPIDVPEAGVILSISPTGLACRTVHAQLDDVLLIGDGIRVSFRLSDHAEPFELLATVCNKSLARDKSYLDLGLEFNREPANQTAQQALERLRMFLSDPATDTTTDGEP